MSAQTVVKRSWGRQLLIHRENIGFGVHLIGLIVVTVLASLWMEGLTTPAVYTMTTSHPMAYLPTNFEVVEGVTNIFKEEVRLGGAGGTGSPQVERSLQAYRENERKDVTHFLTISPCEETIVDYYDFQPEKVIHTSVEQDSPTWERWGLLLGSYHAVKGKIEEGELVLERWFGPNGTSLLLLFLSTVVATVVYIAAIRPLLNWLIIDRIFNRLRLR